jgi:hypothetical protein
MRFTSYILVLFAISAAFAQAPNSNVPYLLTISVPNATTTVGTPVEVQVALENISQKDLAIVKSRASERGELTYNLEVVTTTGVPVELTPYGRALHGLPNTPPIVIQDSPHSRTLKPHEKVVDTVLLSKIYNLTPGSYIVRAKKNPRHNPEANIMSNSLRLTVLPN